MIKKPFNHLKILLLTFLLGGFTGIVVWCFLKAVSLCTGLVWEIIPEKTGSRFLIIPLCMLGGLVCGILHKRFGNYPEDLPVVMGKVKKDKHYDYHPMFVILVCAFLPLVFGSSVGPEAGLTGIIVALCYWVGDNVSYAKEQSALYSEIGEAVTLGQLFHMPLFGILLVEEDSTFSNKNVQYQEGKMETANIGKGQSEYSENQLPALSGMSKLLYYGLSTAASFLLIYILNHLFGKSMTGFPSFSKAPIHLMDYVMLVLYLPAGFLAFLCFEYAEKMTEKISASIPVILRETLCGLVIGCMGLILPMVLFSGEEQMAELMTDYGNYAPLFLIGICFLKLVMTAFCIRFGMKGGHFFPLIFACVCLGIGLSMIVFADPAEHMAFAAAAVTAVTLGAQLKKPFAVSILMLLVFPPRLLFWIFLCAVIGGQTAKIKLG